MKWILGIVGVIVLAVGVCLAIGYSVPLDHVASVRVVYAAEREAAWEVVSDMERWPTWHEEVDAMERQPDRDGKPYWVMMSSWGEMPQIVAESTAPSRFVTVIPDDADIGFGGSWTWELEETDGGTAVTITERGTITSPFFRFVSRYVMGYHASMRTFHENLGRKLGTEVTAFEERTTEDF